MTQEHQNLLKGVAYGIIALQRLEKSGKVEQGATEKFLKEHPLSENGMKILREEILKDLDEANKLLDYVDAMED